MRETDVHCRARRRLYETLQDHFAGVPNVYVASRLVLAYKEGNPKRHRHRDPDGLVARGVGKHLRRSYCLWEEKVVPCVLFEIASRGTWRVDQYQKPFVYAGLGVKEYFLFDPEGCYLDPVLQGFRTVKGKPVPMKPAADGSLLSKQLGLRLVPQGEYLRLVNQQMGEPILTRAEQAEQCAEQERQARAQAEARVKKLEAELQRLRAQLGQQGGERHRILADTAGS